MSTKVACLVLSLLGLVYIGSIQCGILLQSRSECSGKSMVIRCETNESVLPSEVIDGVRAINNGQCEYTSGDCYVENSLSGCMALSSCTATLIALTPIQSCNSKLAEYRTVRYYCVPKTHPNRYDICNTAEITAPNGIIYSPGSPLYQQLNRTCTTKITVPVGKSIDIYTYDIKIKGRNQNQECDDYLKVIDANYEFTYCGSEMEIFKDKFCSNVIYISYKAFDKPANINRGFALYYEMRDLGASTSCTTATPSPPPSEITTTPYIPTEPSEPVNASEYVRFQVCKGKTLQLNAPTFYEIYVEQIEYRVQILNNLCLGPSILDCVGLYTNDCNLRPSCFFSLQADASVFDCQNKAADSITGTYRFIPIKSTIKFFACQTRTIDGDVNPTGVIYSNTYPTYQTNANCQIKLTSSNSNKAFKIYVTDIRTEDSTDCANSYLEIYDNIKLRSKYCGSISLSKQYAFTSCSNNVDLTYKTTSNTNSEYRGFRAYYEIIDYPANCVETTLGPTTTRVTITTQPPSEDVFSSISTTDGQKCVFPFRFNSSSNFDTCVPENNKYWCSTTANYELDKRRGDCLTGPTDLTTFKTCKLNSRTFSCPKGYLINLISIIGFQTTNGVCDASAEICRHDATATFKRSISGKNSYRFVGSPLLLSCNNAASDTTLFEYNCVPDSVPYLNTYDICGSINEINGDTIQNGFIISPNYPATQANLNCNFTIKTNGQNRVLNVYSVGASLHVPLSNQQCSEAFVDINGKKYCGSLLTEFVDDKCSSNFRINYFVGTKAYKGFKFYFEIKNVTNPVQCPDVITTVAPISTTTTPLPTWAAQNLSSGLLTVVSCASNPVYSIVCPNNYVITQRRFFYGKSNQLNCFFSTGDCVGNNNHILRCSGQRECVLPTFSALISECNTTSNYLLVDYECIPTHLSRNRLTCTNTQSFYARNGIITTPSHPTYDKNLNCTARLSTPLSTIIKVYLIETSVDDDCSKDTLTFTEANIAQPTVTCGQYYAELIYESCTDVVTFNIITRQSNDNTLKGVAIYYESVPRPTNFLCPKPITTASTTTRSTTSTTTGTTTTPPVYLGLASPIYTAIVCPTSGPARIESPTNYVIIIRSSVYGVTNSTGTCVYKQDDCFGANTSPISSCSGFSSCSLYYSDFNTVAACANKKNSYMFVEYQFVPRFNAGNPIKPNNTVLCQVPEPVSIAAGSSLLVQSPNYAIYPTSPYTCLNRTITVPRDQVIDVYMLKADFRGSNSCNQSTDYVRMSDGIQNVYFCKFSGNYARFVFRTASNFVNIDSMILSVSPPTTSFYGFQLYLQAVPKPVISTVFTNPPTKSTTTKEISLGFASEEYEVNMCAQDKKELACPKDYIIIVLEEYLVYSTSSCKYTSDDCREPTDLVGDTCKGKESCTIDFIPTPISTCSSQYANGLDFKFICIPAKKMESLKVYSCNFDPSLNEVRNGFIQSPGYPRFVDNIYNCSMELIPPDRSEYRFYAVDFALSNLTGNELLIDTETFVGDQPAELLFTTLGTVNLVYSSPKHNSTSDLDSKYRGFFIYFEAFVSNYVATTSRRTRSTTDDDFELPAFTKKISGGNRSSTLIIATMAVAIPLVLVVILLIFFVNRFASGAGGNMQVEYSNKNQSGQFNEDIKSFSNPL